MAENANRVGRPEGGSLPETVKINARKRVSINTRFESPDIHLAPPSNETRKYYCCMCGKSYVTQKGNFLSGGKTLLWKGNNGFLPFCKSCCDILMESYTAFYSGNEEHALKHLCAMFGWYYNEMASAMTLAQVHRGGSRVALYPSKMSTRQVATHGETFLDTIRDDFGEDEKITEVKVQDHDDSDETNEDAFTVTKAMLRVWGKGFTADQYEFLEDEYADWIAKNVCNTKAQEELYRNIALAQLDVRIAREKGGDVSKAQKALQELMSSANILPKQTADNILADTQTFGTLLKKYEETDPIPEPDESWKDVDGIRKYMNTWFRGGLAKALKVKNENAALYDEATAEMERYTVRTRNVDSTDGGNDASIFDQPEGG